MVPIVYFTRIFSIIFVLFWCVGNALAFDLDYFYQTEVVNHASLTYEDNGNVIFDDEKRKDGLEAEAEIYVDSINWAFNMIGQKVDATGADWAWIRLFAGMYTGRDPHGKGFPFTKDSFSDAVYEFRIKSKAQKKVRLSLIGCGFYGGYSHSVTLYDQKSNRIISDSWDYSLGYGTDLFRLKIDTNTTYYLSYTFSEDNIWLWDASGDLILLFDDVPPTIKVPSIPSNLVIEK